MKLLNCLLVIFVCAMARAEKTLITDVINIGCGLSDTVYSELAKKMPEKSQPQFSYSSKGAESVRRLLFYSDKSWFLTLEFLSDSTVAQDVTCIVAHGSGVESQTAIDYVLVNYPEWKWGTPPPTWPRGSAKVK